MLMIHLESYIKKLLSKIFILYFIILYLFWTYMFSVTKTHVGQTGSVTMYRKCHPACTVTKETNISQQITADYE